ncbi:MAG: beta-galactosidase [Pseudobutyrivibrio sp.]|nr:beta-galactosidase [Pseudobutyrivibrio sp.]
MKELMYGVAYYPEYEHEYRIDEDFQMMKKVGMNVIRVAESTWSTWEKEEGKYDFSILVKTLDKAEEYGLKVIVGTPTYAVPSWLVKKDVDVLATTKKGRWMYGSRQIMDIVNPTYLEAAEKIIRKLLEVVVGYKCVIGFQIDNETKHYGTAGKNVEKLFKEYLKAKFKTVENLNEKFGFAYWSNSINTWDDLPSVLGTINGSYAAEFEKFQRHLAAEFLVWQRRIVDEYRREDQFVTHNFDFYWKQDELAPFGHSYGVQPDINHYEAAKAVTLLGCDIYHPTQDDLTGSEIAYCGDSIRSLKNEQYMVWETEAQGFRYWTPYPGQLRQQAFSHLASGACGVEYWHWHSIHNSYETYWKGILSHDMKESAVYKEAMTIGADFKKIGPYLQKIIKHNKVAIVVDNTSQTALKYFPIGDAKDQPGKEFLEYNDVVRTYYDALYEQNIECDVIDVACLVERVRNYDMIVTPALYCATDETIDALKTFVENGGVLVSSFKSFFADENIQVRQDLQPYKLTDVFGMYYQQFTRPGKTKLLGKEVTVWQELLIADKDTETINYEHKYWGNYAAITKHEYGDGCAFYIGCWCDKDILKDRLKQAAQRAGIETIGCNFSVVVRNVINEAQQNIHFVFNYSEEETVVKCPYENVEDVLTGNRYVAGQDMLMQDWGTLILVEK